MILPPAEEDGTIPENQSFEFTKVILIKINTFKYFNTIVQGFGSRSFGYGSTQKCIKIQNAKEENSSTMLLIIGFHNYGGIFNKTG